MITTNEYLELVPIEINAFFANHHKSHLAMINQFVRVAERPALDEIANNVFGSNSVLFYYISDSYERNNAGASFCKAKFGFTIIATDEIPKKRDEIAFEFKDRICQWLIESTPIAGVSRADNISSQLGAHFFPNGQMISLLEITYDVTLSQGQSFLYGCPPHKPEDIQNKKRASLLGVD